MGVVLASNDSGVLFFLEESLGGRLSANGAFDIIKKDSYQELMRKKIENDSYTELMGGDAIKGRKGYIIIATEEEYEQLKKERRVD